MSAAPPLQTVRLRHRHGQCQAGCRQVSTFPAFCRLLRARCIYNYSNIRIKNVKWDYLAQNSFHSSLTRSQLSLPNCLITDRSLYNYSIILSLSHHSHLFNHSFSATTHHSSRSKFFGRYLSSSSLKGPTSASSSSTSKSATITITINKRYLLECVNSSLIVDSIGDEQIKEW